ncbi:DUF3592 domain-containing protein [Streptomyces sp. NPDC059009]|uniref:DUF3592 domain-containing protein n=1 Tax=Streptomyces sp. NPDC059009 TaxID=3346694 RepID=UPI0036B33B9A
MGGRDRHGRPLPPHRHPWPRTSGPRGRPAGGGGLRPGPLRQRPPRFGPARGTRTFRSPTGSNPPSYERGDRVEVLYRADSPEDARINGFASLWLLPLIFGGIGLVIAGIATGVAVAMRRSS